MDEKIILGGSPSEESKRKAIENNIPQEYIDTEFVDITEQIDLPSLGVFYKNGKKSVIIKSMTAEEDDILYSPELIKNGKVLDVLLDAIIMDKDLRPDEMLAGDRNYVLIEARKLGLGNEYSPDVQFTCEECDEDWTPKNIDLSKLEKKELEISPDSVGEYSVQLPVTKMNIKFRLLNGSDEKRLTKVAESGQKKQGNFKVAKLITEKYLLQIMEVNGQRDKTYIKKFISHMPTKDSLFFREYSKNIDPGINLEYKFECPNCLHENVRDTPITARLFYPETKA